MLCKYYLQIGSSKVTVGSDGCFDVSSCVLNAQELNQSFVRKDYGGVTRKYGSTIEFEGVAYDLLVEHYRNQYLNCEAAFSIHVVDDNWVYSEAWQCPLDFSTFSYDGHKVSLNCVDSSAAALIKANGNIKHSFPVSQLKETAPMKYDRIVMPNELTFGFDGESQSGSSDSLWRVTSKSDGLAHVATIPMSVRDSSGVSDNKVTWDTESLVFYGSEYDTDHLAYEYDYFLEAGSSFVVLTLDFSECLFTPTDVEKTGNHAGSWQNQTSEPYSFRYFLISYIPGSSVITIQKTGEFSGPFVPFDGRAEVSLQPGERLSFVIEKAYWDDIPDPQVGTYYHSLWVMAMSNNVVKVTWDSIGAPIYMDVITPSKLLSHILDKVADGKMMIRSAIDGQVGGVTNDRLSGAMIIAAESVRGLPDAMIHTSFNEFCKFMEAEYGYVYRIEPYVRQELVFNGFIDPEEVQGRLFNGKVSDSVSEVYFIRTGEWDDVTPCPAGLFVGYNDADGTYVTYWGSGPNWSAYNHKNNYRNPYNRSYFEPNEDPVFVNLIDGKQYIHKSGVLDLQLYDPVLDDSSLVRFLHRSDLFTDDVVKELQPSADPEFSLSDDILYAGVTIGYEKQDYENDNAGRDEWNFENEYITGVSLKDTKLELICPYRADCYGFEELAATREKKDNDKESTDSDEDVFIIKCESALTDGNYVVDRSVNVVGAYTWTVFNALLAPIYMVMANKGYISSFCLHLRLSMTHGSRDIVIDGQAVTKDFDFDVSDRLFKAGNLKIHTSDQSVPSDFAGLVSFVWDGVTYKGYVKSVTLKYQREETVEYELIEKSQEYV